MTFCILGEADSKETLTPTAPPCIIVSIISLFNKSPLRAVGKKLTPKLSFEALLKNSTKSFVYVKNVINKFNSFTPISAIIFYFFINTINRSSIMVQGSFINTNNKNIYMDIPLVAWTTLEYFTSSMTTFLLYNE